MNDAAQSSVMHSALPLPHARSGKVRDLYDITLPDGSMGLLLVATDRISAFDVVMNNPIPGKGIVLTQMAKFWFDFFADRIDHHLEHTEVDRIAELDEEYRQPLRGRIMAAHRTKVIPIECVVRGYLAGSGWKAYQRDQQVCGVELPAGLVEASRLDEPIFTPATKAETGHDVNITFAEACQHVGEDLMGQLRKLSLMLYKAAHEYALPRGIIIADTKFEFGLPLSGEPRPILIDEILTPDSSRFWPAEQYEPGRSQYSFDKQFVRDYLQGLCNRGEWDKTPTGPTLPDEVIQPTLKRYVQAYEMLTGQAIGL